LFASLPVPQSHFFQLFFFFCLFAPVFHKLVHKHSNC
jgi:hypothetical protein